MLTEKGPGRIGPAARGRCADRPQVQVVVDACSAMWAAVRHPVRLAVPVYILMSTIAAWRLRRRRLAWAAAVLYGCANGVSPCCAPC
ncbi:hypothetical protein ACTMU2_35290 [Cupriavidus basilensis]